MKTPQQAHEEIILLTLAPDEPGFPESSVKMVHEAVRADLFLETVRQATGPAPLKAPFVPTARSVRLARPDPDRMTLVERFVLGVAVVAVVTAAVLVAVVLLAHAVKGGVS